MIAKFLVHGIKNVQLFWSKKVRNFDHVGLLNKVKRKFHLQTFNINP